MVLRWLLAIAMASHGMALAVSFRSARTLPRRDRTMQAVLASENEALAEGTSLLGKVVSVGSLEGLVVVRPEARELIRIGALLSFGRGGTGVVLAERCGLYFAKAMGGTVPTVAESVSMINMNMTVHAWEPIDGNEWGGVVDYLGGGDTQVAQGATPTTAVNVFGEPVPAARRRPIGSSLHTGVVAIESLAPIGRGQSMMLFGPDGLPSGCGRTDLALRVIGAQHQLGSDVKCMLVLSGPEHEREQTLAAMRESGVLDHTRVLVANTPLEAIVAASAACSIAESCQEDDVLVVVDSLRPHLELWKAICAELEDLDVAVSPEEEGSQQRAFYARLVERAARRKEGGSVTLLLLQPSVSVLPSESTAKESYSLADFESAGFTNTVCSRVKLLEEKGIRLTQEVLVKVGIPLPGSDHPAAGRGQQSAQHLEELTSLVDGHIDLRESLAASGRNPPIDPSNSLTRIGVGSSKLRPLSQAPAMAKVCGPLRLELASAADYVHCEADQARRAAAYMAVLQQPEPSPLTLGEEVALVRAAASGALDTIVATKGNAEVSDLLRNLLDHVSSAAPELMPRISETLLLGDNVQQQLDELTIQFLRVQTE